MYKVFRVAILAMMIPIVSLHSQEIGRRTISSPPLTKRTSFVYVSSGEIVGDLRDLIYKSDLVIQGHVKSVSETRFTIPGNDSGIETDFEVIVNRVFKSKRGGRTDNFKQSYRIFVSQTGGKVGEIEEVPVEYTLLTPGESYILFLKNDDRNHLPNVDLRYVITGVWHGAFQIDDQDTLKVSRYSNFRAFNDQKRDKDDFIVEILNTYHKWMKNDKAENN
jgi:hypothetical protein